MAQLALALEQSSRSRRGGKRRNAGRKPRNTKAGVSHARRPRIEGLLPVHVTMRMKRHVYNLRSRRAFSIIGPAIAAAASRFGVRILEFSVQGNHVHFVVEAAAHEALSRAMQGLAIRIAKGLNGMMKRTGAVLADRYHEHVLATPREARNAVLYVRHNYRKHMNQIGKPISHEYVDPFSSCAAPIELPAPRARFLVRIAAPP